IPKPVVYRALGRLERAGLVRLEGTEQSAGPQRQLYRVAPHGHDELLTWLDTPVGHVRELRSAFLLKLALLDRRGVDRRRLVRAQREALAPIDAAFHQEAAAGFDGVLAAWRRANLNAAAEFLADLENSTNRMVDHDLRAARDSGRDSDSPR